MVRLRSHTLQPITLQSITTPTLHFRSQSLSRSLNTAASGGVRDILRAEIEELQLYGVNSQSLLSLIHWGRAVVILDGFDELIAEVGYDSARSNLRALREFLSGQARLLLTSRTAFLSTNAEVLGVLEPEDKDDIEILRLEPFDRAGQERYLGSLGLSSPEVGRTMAYLDSFPALPSSATSPLLLNTIARLAKAPQGSSPQIDELYELHVETLCSRERERQNHSISNDLQVECLPVWPSRCTKTACFNTIQIYWESSGKRPENACYS